MKTRITKLVLSLGLFASIGVFSSCEGEKKERKEPAISEKNQTIHGKKVSLVEESSPVLQAGAVSPVMPKDTHVAMNDDAQDSDDNDSDDDEDDSDEDDSDDENEDELTAPSFNQ